MANSQDSNIYGLERSQPVKGTVSPEVVGVPGSKSQNIPEVVLVRRWAVGVLGIWRGGVGWVKDGLAMVQDIEDAALNTTTKLLPADVFKMIESCMAALNQKVRVQMQWDEVTRQKEPERLKQIEAIREQATMLHGSRLNKDKPTEESVVKTMRDAVIEYMAAVDQDKEDGLYPDSKYRRS